MNQENFTYHYGLTSLQQAIELAIQVCDVLGYGACNTAPLLLLETAAAETQMGTFVDPTPTGAGFGLCQMDKIAFEDIQDRTRPTILSAIKVAFGYQLLHTSVEQLQHDPLLSFICCRLHYRLRPEPIPKTLQGRAEYWKQFYNSQAGKGTTEHYKKSATFWLSGDEHDHQPL